MYVCIIVTLHGEECMPTFVNWMIVLMCVCVCVALYALYMCIYMYIQYSPWLTIIFSYQPSLYLLYDLVTLLFNNWIIV